MNTTYRYHCQRNHLTLSTKVLNHCYKCFMTYKENNTAYLLSKITEESTEELAKDSNTGDL